MSKVEIQGWKMYYRTTRPTTAPHEEVDITPVLNGQIWKIGKTGNHPILARWTSNFDCGYKTEWWYCIKDEPFSLEDVKAKKRYYIKKGLENFDVRVINPSEYIEELFVVATEAYKNYSSALIDKSCKAKEIFEREICRTDIITFGAFEKQNNQLLCGYANVKIYDSYADFMTLKVIPKYEKRQINAALIFGILDYLKDKLGNGYYLSDGMRNILHETNFQNYLISYFGFRLAYCNLHIAYRPLLRPIINILYIFRDVCYKLKNNKYMSKICAILCMEEIARSCQKGK